MKRLFGMSCQIASLCEYEHDGMPLVQLKLASKMNAGNAAVHDQLTGSNLGHFHADTFSDDECGESRLFCTSWWLLV